MSVLKSAATRFVIYEAKLTYSDGLYDQPIDFDLIADITRWRVSCVEGTNK